MNHYLSLLREAASNIEEEMGVTKGLEPLRDYILDMAWELLPDGGSKEFRMSDVKNAINCTNWYGLDNLAAIEVSVRKDYREDYQASADVVGAVGEIEINSSKLSVIPKLKEYGKDPSTKEMFHRECEEWIMHELTHMAEIISRRLYHNKDEQGIDKVRTVPHQEKGPSYNILMPHDVANANYAFSESEMQARVNQLYQAIKSNPYAKIRVNQWNESESELCKSFIMDNKDSLWLDEMQRVMNRMKNASRMKGWEDAKFAKSFIEATRNSAFHGYKNTFGLRWKYAKDKYGNNDYDNVSKWDDSNENVAKIATRIYRQMDAMFRRFVRRLYSVAKMAVDELRTQPLEEGSWGYNPEQSDAGLDKSYENIRSIINTTIKNCSENMSDGNAWSNICAIQKVISMLKDADEGYHISDDLIDVLEQNLDGCENSESWIETWSEPDELRKSFKRIHEYIDDLRSMENRISQEKADEEKMEQEQKERTE